MNKTGFVQAMQEALGDQWTKAHVTYFMDTFERVVGETLAGGEDVSIAGFMKFSVKVVPARAAGEYPGMGGVVKHYDARPETKKVRVSAFKRLKDVLGDA